MRPFSATIDTETLDRPRLAARRSGLWGSVDLARRKKEGQSKADDAASRRVTEASRSAHVPPVSDAPNSRQRPRVLRPAGRLFRLSDAHIDAITAAEATPIGDARGDTRVVDWATIAPGDESLEEISRRIRVHLFLQFERRWFTIYCEINLPRLIAHLELRLDEEGWPFTAADIAAEVCARQLRQDRKSVV